jgi:hypothetical protein
MRRVLIEVKGGVVEVVRAPKEAVVEIIDLDLLREGDVEDIRRHWNDGLSAAARAHVKHRYPKMFEFLTAQCAH